MRIILHTAEQGHKNQNHVAEQEIGFLAKRWKLQMTKKRYRNGCGALVLCMKVNYYPEWLVEPIIRLDMKKLPDKPQISANGWTLSSMILYGGWIDQSNQMLWTTHVS